MLGAQNLHLEIETRKWGVGCRVQGAEVGG